MNRGTTRSEHTGPTGRTQVQPFLIAGVGASAGGLDALTALVENVPADSRLALVLIQHLAADHSSLLKQIVAERTTLDVREAVDGDPIEPGRIYVIRPGTEITIAEDVLRVRRVRRDHGRPTQIDRLFESLAASRGQRAVAVVLSGTGEDGTEGLRRVKKGGGVTIVQTPEDAKVDGMPRAAIATGAVDMVLPAREIARELARLSRQPPFAFPAAQTALRSTLAEDSGPPEPDSNTFSAPHGALMLDAGEDGDADADEDAARELKAEQLAPVFRLLRQTTGIDLANYKAPTVLRRVQRRLALRHLHSVEEYLEFLQRNPAEMDELKEDVLIHVTSFFREPDSFLALQETVFPEIFRRGADSIRIWVPGCSSGEEVYSLAIALSETLTKIGHTCDSIQIFGTDVSDRSIDKARAGLYSPAIATEVSPERLRRFFIKTENGYHISKAVRQHCVFARQDTTRDPPFSRLDMVVCRNVLIYLSQAIQQKLIRVFHYALKPGGFLVLGRAETTGGEVGLFTTPNKRFKIYSKLGDATTPVVAFNSQALAALGTRRSDRERTALSLSLPKGDLISDLDRLLLNRYAPPGIILDDDLRIIRTRGRTAPFLELPEGDATLEALKVVRRGLLQAVRAALDEARRTGAPVRKKGIDLSREKGRPIIVEAIPYVRGDTRHFLVTFEQRDAARSPGSSARTKHSQGSKKRGNDTPTRTPPGNRASANSTVERLRRELAASSQELEANIRDLAVANEELQSANEEIRSSNEELQSTNEELDTAKEELQSTNEELSTLNEELQGRNEELSQANSDLANFPASVDIPIVMITNDLRIRRFTPAAEQALNLIASDIGRPIGHIRPNIVLPDLEQRIRRVIQTGEADERDVEDTQGRIYSLRLRAYRGRENEVNGAVLSLVDISEAKMALKRATEMGEALMFAMQDPILLLDADLKVKRANAALYDAFRMAPAEMEGRVIFDLKAGPGAGPLAGPLDSPELKAMLDAVRRGDRHIESVRIVTELEGVGRKSLVVDGRSLDGGAPATGDVLLIIREERQHGG